MNFQYTGSMQVSALLKIAYLNDMRGITACLPKKEGMLKKSQTTEKKLFLNSDKSIDTEFLIISGCQLYLILTFIKQLAYPCDGHLLLYAHCYRVPNVNCAVVNVFRLRK